MQGKTKIFTGCAFILVAPLLLQGTVAFAQRGPSPLPGSNESKSPTQQPSALNPVASCSIPGGAQPDTDHELGLGKIPPVLRVGTQIDIKITTPVKGVAVCLDSVPVTSLQKDSELQLTIPQSLTDPTLPWPRGDHFLTIIFPEKTVLRQALRSAPQLLSVRVLAMGLGENSFLVRFVGDGFDADKHTNNSIQMVIGGGANSNQNVRWTDSVFSQSCATLR